MIGRRRNYEQRPLGSDAEEERRAIQRAVDLLSRRAYATAELRSRLARSAPPEAVDAAIRRLEAAGFLDDGAWARSYVGSGRGSERSSALLRRELRAKGVEGEDAAEALAEHDDRAAALAAAERRLRALERLDPAVRARRLRDYLARRGFSGNDARAAMDALLPSTLD